MQMLKRSKLKNHGQDSPSDLRSRAPDIQASYAFAKQDKGGQTCGALVALRISCELFGLSGRRRRTGGEAERA